MLTENNSCCLIDSCVGSIVLQEDKNTPLWLFETNKVVSSAHAITSCIMTSVLFLNVHNINSREVTLPLRMWREVNHTLSSVNGSLWHRLYCPEVIKLRVCFLLLFCDYTRTFKVCLPIVNLNFLAKLCRCPQWLVFLLNKHKTEPRIEWRKSKLHHIADKCSG